MINYIRKFSMLQRFSVLGLLAVLLFMVPFSLYLSEVRDDIQSVAKERAGLLLSGQLLDAISALQTHRGATVAALKTGGPSSERRLTALAKVDTAMGVLGKVATASNTTVPLKETIEKTLGEWQTLRSALAAKTLDMDEVRLRHNRIIHLLSEQRNLAIDESGLSMDPEANTYHLIMGTAVHLPGLIDALTRLRARAADALVANAASEEDRSAASVFLEKVGFFDRGVDTGFAKAIAIDASLKAPLGPLVKQAQQQLKEVMALSRAVLVGADTGITPTAYRARMNEAIAAHDALGAAGHVELMRLFTEREHERYTVLYTVVAVSAGFLSLSLLLGFFIARSVVQPVVTAARIADAVAQGDLDCEVAGEFTDEAGHLFAAMRRMQNQLRAFAAAQGEIKARHEAGEISYRMDAGLFPGAFGLLAQQNNDLASSYIELNARVVEVVSRYAKGDLSVDMERLPGEKAKITAAVDGVKASLQAVNGQIQALVEAAARGDFSVRGDEAGHEHEVRKMVAGLNRLMQTSDTGLHEISRVLGALAQGDLTEQITYEGQGTFGQLKEDCNKTVDYLSAIVKQIKDAARTIDTASREITQGNGDLAQRTENLAGSLEETASAMEQLTGTVKQNAENARQANQLAVGASDVAVKGGAVVKQVVSTMNGISASSRKIADIVGTIDGIAFQTNILALNAAVEAARAGEQGRGFAVVATEVRSLAQRSTNAAREIKQLISESVSTVEAGSKLVHEAGQTMDEIVNSVMRVTDIMAEITAASQEQSAGIEQVNQAIIRMDDVTQQNAALVEQAAAAAESMQVQSGSLVQTVALFRLPAQVEEDVPAERRSPQRAANVARLAPKPAARAARRAPNASLKKAVGTDDEWQEF